MFDRITEFFDQIMAVFFGSSAYTFEFGFEHSYSGTYVNSSWALIVSRNQCARLLSAFVLIGLSVFLFYQVYKLIHAFVGGFYE